MLEASVGTSLDFAAVDRIAKSVRCQQINNIRTIMPSLDRWACLETTHTESLLHCITCSTKHGRRDIQVRVTEVLFIQLKILSFFSSSIAFNNFMRL